MNPRALYLMEVFIDETITEAELRELQQFVADEPEIGAELARMIELHGLATSLKNDDFSELTKRVTHAIDELSPDETEQEVLQLIKPAPTKKKWGYWAMAIAAQILIILGLFLGRSIDSTGLEIATVSMAEGSTFLVRGEKKIMLKTGVDIKSGDQIFVEDDSSVTIRYADESELYLRDRSYIKLIDDRGAKNIHLFAGTLHGDIQKQQRGKPMQLITEDSLATVVGTRFELSSSDVSTLLEVHEGHVRIEQPSDETVFDVVENQFAISKHEDGINVRTEGRPIFESEIITKDTPGLGVDIEVDVKGAKKIYLVTLNGRDNNRCDHVAWLNPVLHGEQEFDLTKQQWVIEKSGWMASRVNTGLFGEPLQVEGVICDRGISTHATSIISYDIPENYQTFTCRAVLLDSGVDRPKTHASVQFKVYTELPEETLQKLLIRKFHY